jgi:hypothetical protein
MLSGSKVALKLFAYPADGNYFPLSGKKLYRGMGLKGSFLPHKQERVLNPP